MHENISQLKQQADQLRLEVVKMVHDAGDGHPGPCMSAMDILTCLYFDKMHIDPQNPKDPNRDRFLLSKGHACPALYAALANKGYFSKEEYSGLRFLHRMLQGHPTMQKTPGRDMTSGSLGNGLGIAAGMSFAGRYQKQDYYTYVIMGDGEIQEGSVWEAAMFASHHKLDHLIAFVDNNCWQSGGSIDACSGVQPIAEKWEAFGWFVQQIDGHDYEQILSAIEAAQKNRGRPSMIVAHTIKGKGLDYMENDNSWHKRVPTDEQLASAIKQLGGNAQ